MSCPYDDVIIICFRAQQRRWVPESNNSNFNSVIFKLRERKWPGLNFRKSCERTAVRHQPTYWDSILLDADSDCQNSSAAHLRRQDASEQTNFSTASIDYEFATHIKMNNYKSKFVKTRWFQKNVTTQVSMTISLSFSAVCRHKSLSGIKSRLALKKMFSRSNSLSKGVPSFNTYIVSVNTTFLQCDLIFNTTYFEGFGTKPISFVHTLTVRLAKGGSKHKGLERPADAQSTISVTNLRFSS